MSRFDYVKYDDVSVEQQKLLKAAFEDLEKRIESTLFYSPAKSTAIRKLEEAYMWAGKAIRDSQLERVHDGLVSHKTTGGV